MNYWAQMLGGLPASWQRLIARTNRISLPHGAGPDVRHARICQALCHAATVRETYCTLDPEVQAALQDLRGRHSGMRVEDLQQRYGAIRSARQLTADPRPRTIAERLALIGWLLYRPAEPHHPARYLLPPELRGWLPRPLALPTYGAAAASPPPLALRVATSIILACADGPIDLRENGTLRRHTVQFLSQRLCLDLDSTGRVAGFVLPLLYALGLVAAHRGTCTLTLAGQRFLALPAAERLGRLRRAWLNAPNADGVLTALLPDQRGINWPYLRQRLCAWVEALPADQLLDPDSLYPALVAAFGPLADTHTHGFRFVDRVPWQPRRAAAIFQAALRGPLHWLGFVAWEEQTTAGNESRFVVRPINPARDSEAALWRYGAPGMLIVPHDGEQSGVLRLLPFVRWEHADGQGTAYRVSAATITRAQSQGWNTEILWDVLARQTGSPPAQAWRAGLEESSPQVCMTYAVVVIAEPAALLERALRARSVRRYMDAHVAPGIVLVQPERAEPFARALERQQIAVVQSDPPPAPPPTGLTEGECASLLVACAFYQAHAPEDAPLPPNELLQERLRAALPGQLREAVNAALVDLAPAAPRAAPQPADGPAMDGAAQGANPLSSLRQAIATRRLLEITYNTGGDGAWTQRTIRPLALEQRGDCWYLSAYCMARGEERTFRVDRIGSIGPPCHR